MKRCLSLALLLSACQGTEPPPEVLPRILEGECVRIAMQTGAGDGERELVIDNLRARTTSEAGCGRIRRLEIGGWMDANKNDRVDPGEALESSTFLAPEGGTDELTLEGVSLKIPEGRLKDLKLELSVHFTSGKTTHIEVDARE